MEIPGANEGGNANNASPARKIFLLLGLLNF